VGVNSSSVGSVVLVERITEITMTRITKIATEEIIAIFFLLPAPSGATDAMSTDGSTFSGGDFVGLSFLISSGEDATAAPTGTAVGRRTGSVGSKDFFFSLVNPFFS